MGNSIPTESHKYSSNKLQSDDKTRTLDNKINTVDIKLSKDEYEQYKEYMENKNNIQQYYTPGLSSQLSFNSNIGTSTKIRNNDYVDVNIPEPQYQHIPIENTMLNKTNNINHNYNQRIQTNIDTNNQSNIKNKKKINEIKDNIDITKLDPFNILLKKKITLLELKQCYKKLSIIHHPDKGGKLRNFNLVIEAYNYINDIIIMQQSDKTHTELKNNYNNLKLPQNQNINDIWNKDEFNLKKFNKIYEQTKMNSNYDDGYGNIMIKSSINRDDIKIENDIGKYNKKKFNKNFNNKNKLQNKIIKYTPPKPLEPQFNNYTILGEENISDFSGKRGNIEYTDYKKAHIDGFFIETEQVGYKTYNSIEELQKDRENINLRLEQINAIEKYEELDKKKEWDRQTRLKEYDNNVEKQYNSINKQMLY